MNIKKITEKIHSKKSGYVLYSAPTAQNREIHALIKPVEYNEAADTVKYHCIVLFSRKKSDMYLTQHTVSEVSEIYVDSFYRKFTSEDDAGALVLKKYAYRTPKRIRKFLNDSDCIDYVKNSLTKNVKKEIQQK